MNKYYVLSLILGILCKLYDDLYDNDLYEYFNISKENKSYLNEFLKSLFALGFSVLAIKYFLFYLFFLTINLVLLTLKKTDFGPYELSGMYASIILIPFVDWSYDIEENNLENHILFLIFGSIGKSQLFLIDILCVICASATLYITEKMIGLIDIEYSYKKFIIRSIEAFILILLLFISNNFLFLSENIIICVLFTLGYLLTSSFFQYILLSKNPTNI